MANFVWATKKSKKKEIFLLLNYMSIISNSFCSTENINNKKVRVCNCLWAPVQFKPCPLKPLSCDALVFLTDQEFVTVLCALPKFWSADLGQSKMICL